MNIESMSQIVQQSLLQPDFEKLRMSNSSYWRGQCKALLSIIPYVGGAAAEELQQYYDYKDDEFFRKFARYLLGLKDTTEEERNQFAEEIQDKADDLSGNVIFGMVERLDNINKESVLAKLTIAKINNQISIEDFFRLQVLLERIPYVDLKELSRYLAPYYDTSGGTELLYASGALVLDTLDANGGPNLYVLSILGEMLLRWGFDIDIEQQRENGINVNLPVIPNADMDALFEEK